MIFFPCTLASLYLPACFYQRFYTLCIALQLIFVTFCSLSFFLPCFDLPTFSVGILLCTLELFTLLYHEHPPCLELLLHLATTFSLCRHIVLSCSILRKATFFKTAGIHGYI